MTASVVYSENVTKLIARDGSIHKKIGASKQIDQIAALTTSLDEANDLMLFAPIPSNAVITSVKLLCDDLDSNVSPALVANVGLYYSGIGGVQAFTGKTVGTVVDADCFATLITDLQAAVKTPLEVRFEADDIVDIKKEAWEVGGLSADCGGFLLVGIAVTTAAGTAAAGDIVVIVETL